MVRSLDKVWGELFVVPGKKAKEITKCGHIERKDQGCTASIILPIQWILWALHLNPYLAKIVSAFTCQLSAKLDSLVDC